MKNNLFASIVESNRKIQSSVIAYNCNSNTQDDLIMNDGIAATTARTDEQLSNVDNKPSMFNLLINEVELRVVSSMLSKSYHIEYKIVFTDMNSNQFHHVYRRYRDMFEFYNQLCLNDQIKDHTDLRFPEQDVWFLSSSEKYDINSAFINRRKDDLQLFFRRLFAQNEYLYTNKYINSFFELPASFQANKVNANSSATTSINKKMYVV